MRLKRQIALACRGGETPDEVEVFITLLSVLPRIFKLKPKIITVVTNAPAFS